MAAPTATTSTLPNYVIDVTGTNVDAGNNDYTLEYNQVNLSKGFSIVTGTLTAMTVTLLAYNKDGVAKDVTSDLCGAAALASDTAYFIDIPSPVKGIIVRAARSNATNAVAFTIFAPKK